MVGSTASLVWWWLATPSRCQPWGLNSRGPKTRVTLELHHAVGAVAIVGGSVELEERGTNGDEEKNWRRCWRTGRGQAEGSHGLPRHVPASSRLRCGVPAVAGRGRIYMSYRAGHAGAAAACRPAAAAQGTDHHQPTADWSLHCLAA